MSSFLSKNKQSSIEGKQVSDMENISNFKVAYYRSTSSSNLFPSKKLESREMENAPVIL